MTIKKVMVITSSVLLMAGCAQRAGMGQGGATADAGTANEKGSGAKALIGESAIADLPADDASFVRNAAQMGAGEVRMAQLADQNSSDQKTKDFARKILDDHTKANQELMQLASQKGLQAPQQASATDTMRVERLSNLKGEEFDRAFDKAAVESHEKAVRVFRNASERCQDADLKAFAQKQLPILEEHLRMAREMNKGDSGSSSTDSHSSSSTDSNSSSNSSESNSNQK